MRGHDFRRAGLILLGVLPVGMAWLLVAPTVLGGMADYVVTSGSSMEPALEAGDLAVIRPAGHYDVGDVVAFHSATVGDPLLHRVVARDGDRYVTRGDANQWLDADRPLADEIAGRLWFRIPNGGAFLAPLRQPAAPAALGAATGVAMLLRSRRGRRRAAPHPSPALVGTVRVLAPRREQLVAGCTAGALVAAAVFLVLLALPASVRRADVGYRHEGTFTYGGEAPVGDVYQAAALRTGDAVFIGLVPSVDVRFDYAFRSDAAFGVQGVGRLFAQLGDAEGWTRRFDLTEPLEVAGGKLTLAGRLDLVALREAVQAVERATGVDRTTYTVRVVAEIDVVGDVAGEALSDRFAGPVTFELNDTRLRMTAEQDALAPTQAGGVTAVRGERTIRVGGLELPTVKARAAALAVLALSLAGLAGAAALRREADATGASLLPARQQALLLPAAHLPVAGPEAIEVGDLRSLLRLAEEYERYVLHAATAAGDVYRFDDGGTTYTFHEAS